MPATTVIAISVARRRVPADHRFYVCSAVVALAIAVVASLPGMIDPSSRRGSLTPLAAMHAAAFTGGWSCTSPRRCSPAPAISVGIIGWVSSGLSWPSG